MHSRPLDVHRWSDHPQAIRLAERIWGEHFNDYGAQDKKPGPKPKTTYQHQLKVALLDLYVAWLTDPELALRVPMSSNGWNSNSRYNALHMTRRITEMVTRLHEVGLIDLNPGSYSGRRSMTNRITRIRAAAPLVALFQETQLRQTDIRQFEGQECVILKDNDDDGDGHEIPYDDTPTTIEMRRNLRAYNALLLQTFIDFPDKENDYVVRVGRSGPETGREVRVSTAASRIFVRRIFGRGSWELNGRFYGGWWQQFSKAKWDKIYINDLPTVEVDFKGMHVAMLSLQAGVLLTGDPYALPLGVVPGVPAELQRAIVKQLVLTTINARDKKTAFGAFRDGWPTGHIGKGMTNAQLQQVVNAFVDRHPHLANSLCTDQGIRLMFRDSQIASFVIRDLTRDEVPVLCIHDSFIVAYDQGARLKGLMDAITTELVGVPLPAAPSWVGLDEMRADETVPDYVVDGYVEGRRVTPCRG